MKENTHLFFAEKISANLKNENLKSILEKNLDYYSLGSVFPDIFYHNKKTSEVSKEIHGRDREKTNGLIFEFLNLAKETKSDKDFAFTLGYISHYVLDVKMHPIIFYLTGNYYDKDLNKRFDAMMKHRQLETIWDTKLTSGYFLCKRTKLSLFDGLGLTKIIDQKYGIDKDFLIEIFAQCKKHNRLFRSRFVYIFGLFLVKFGLYENKSILGFFLASKNPELEKLGDDLEYRDLVSGEERKANLYSSFEESEIYAEELLQDCYKYYSGEMSFEDLNERIKGESLNTGKVDCGVDDIVYTKYSYK